MSTLTAIYETALTEERLTRDPAQVAVLPEFERLRTALSQTRKHGLFRRRAATPKGLYLWGGVGRGKSMLMDLFVGSLDTIPARRIHFHSFMQDIHAALESARQSGTPDALVPVANRIAADTRLLALDEIQITDIADAMIVGRLFQALFDAGTVIVTTSNRPPDDLYKDGLNRHLFLPFIDMLKERMEIRELAGPTDHRLGRTAGAQSYFTPADARARAAIDTLWQKLTGGGGTPRRIEVQGRDIVLPEFHDGIARASFYDLCAKPLGPADYLAIAESVELLILEDIPCLSRSNFNEARRFVTLIDALYEGRRRLVASAEDEPESLYREGEGAFEFQRTVSRLREMQADDWPG
ncbi:cell division protein ZapE [Pontibaca methylaminivorans]|uniref:cell division protein ZapE n=1 Tax=Pontibaca methylaminivorans TaxID=515897 RepID=UPI002FD9D3E4